MQPELGRIGPGDARRRDAAAALAAVALHALALWAAGRTPVELARRALPAERLAIVDLELSLEAAERAAPPPAIVRDLSRSGAVALTRRPSAATAPAAAGAEARPERALGSADGADEYGGAAPESAEPSAEGASGPGRGVGVLARGIALGAPPPAAPAPTAAAPPRPPDRDVAGAVLAGTLRARDAKLGGRDPWAGDVANHVGDAVRAASLPPKTRATIAVRFDARGALAGVEVERSSAGDAAGWAAITRAIAAAVAARPPPAATAAGTRVVVIVQSLRLLPAESSGLLAPGVRWFDPPELDTAGGRFDLSNIGAHEQTVIRWSLSVVRPGERAQPAGAVLPFDDAERWVPARRGHAERPGKPCPAEGRGCPEPVLRPLRSVRTVLDMRPGDD